MTTPETRYLILPRRRAGIEHLTEQALAVLVTRYALIGTAAV
ncbi:nitrile hydratase subunit alpha [Streptomyces sp. MMS24-I2-30]